MSGDLQLQDGTSRGGLFVVVVCFFVFGFLATLAIQFLVSLLLNSLQDRELDSPELLGEVVNKKLIEPASHLSPEEVVSIQLDGLGSTNQTVGIRQCFAFASPSNKSITGPLTRFASMVHRPPYDALLKPQELLIGKPEIHDDHASVTVTMLDSRGKLQAFLFLLGRQNEGEYSGCWMTEGVFPLQPLAPPESASPPTVWSPRKPMNRTGVSNDVWCPNVA